MEEGRRGGEERREGEGKREGGGLLKLLIFSRTLVSWLAMSLRTESGSLL